MSKLEPFFRELWPNATAALVKESAARFPALCNKYGYVKDVQISGLFGNIAEESQRGSHLVENMNYSVAQALKIFGQNSRAKLTPAEAQKLCGNQQAFAMRVYGVGGLATMLGNTSPIDGWNFRGNGLGQTTGRYNHQVLMNHTGFNVIDHPEMLRDPTMALECTMANYKALGFLQAVLVSFSAGVGKINSAKLHLSNRQAEANRAAGLMKKYNVMSYVGNPALNDEAGATAVIAPNKPKLNLTGKPITLLGDVADDAPTDHVVVMTQDVAGDSTTAQVQKVETPVGGSAPAVIMPDSMAKERLAIDVTGDPIIAQKGDDDAVSGKNIVKPLQEKLNELSFYCTADGKYGDRTAAALFLAESTNGLVTDGKLSQSDWDFLSKEEPAVDDTVSGGSGKVQPAVISEERQNLTVKEVVKTEPIAHSTFSVMRIVKWVGSAIFGINVADNVPIADTAKSAFDNYDGIKEGITKVQDIFQFLFHSPIGLSIIALAVLGAIGYFANSAVQQYVTAKRTAKIN